MNSLFAITVLLANPLADARALPEDCHHCIRYVRIGGEIDAKVASLALNLVSTSSVIKPPSLAAQFLLRVDARDYVRVKDGHADPVDLKRFLDTWEELRFDPAFNELEVVKGKVARKSLHDPALVALLGTEAPVVDVAYMVSRMLSTIKDQGGNNGTIFGGLYYEFSDTPKTEGELLQKLKVEGTDDLVKLFNEIPSQRRAAQERSAVTGKARRFDFLPTLARFGAWYIATRDQSDGQQDSNSDPFLSLARMLVAAVESIYVRFNGLPGYALFNGQGERQDEAPNNGPVAVVAADQYRDRFGNRIPHASRLQIFSCFECHWSGDNRGLIPFKNDVLAKRQRGLVPVDPVVDRLYQADPKQAFSEVWLLVDRGQSDLAAAVFLTSKIEGLPEGWPDGEQRDQKQAVRVAGAALTRMWHEYMHEPLDAKRALAELGVKPPDGLGDAVNLLNKLVPLTRGEPKALTNLREGSESVSRFDWSLAIGVAVRRMR